MGAIASVHTPELAVFELPFIFESDAEADHVLNVLRDRTAKILADHGFIMVMWAENGWHGYGVKGKGKCITSPDSLKGTKMRSQESSIHLETYKAFGAAPVEIPVPEVLAALQTGTVDGYSNTPLFSFATSWYTGIDTFTYTKHMYQTAVLVFSKKWFAPSTIWCSSWMPFWVLTFSMIGITSLAGATRSCEPCTNRPEDGQGARKVKSNRLAGAAIEMKPSISGRRIRSCMPIHAPKEMPVIQQARASGLMACAQSSAVAASDNSP